MSVIVTIPTPLRRYASGKSELKVEAKTAGEALELLTAAHADLRKHLYTEQDKLRHFVNIYVNEDDIRYGNGIDTALKDGDTITIVPAIAGGSLAADSRR